MIKNILSFYTTQLNEFLSRYYHRPEGLAEIGTIDKSQNATPENKLVVCLQSLERETAGGIACAVQPSADGGYIRRPPALQFNLNVLLAAVFEERQYVESLSILSDTLRFIQSHSSFVVDGVTYTVEVFNLSARELNDTWALLGGHYYPSIMVKIRRISIDTQDISSSSTAINNPVVEL